MNFEKLNIEKLKKLLRNTKEVSVKTLDSLKEKITEKYESSSLDLSFMNKVHFNFHHFTTVSMIAILAFFVTVYTTGFNTATVDAAGLDKPVVKNYNKKALDVNFGDSKTIAKISKEILKDHVSDVEELTEISNTGVTSTYGLGSYVVTVEMENTSGVGEKSASLKIQTKSTFEKDESEKIVSAVDGNLTSVAEGTVYTYNLKLNVIDTEAPRINLSESDITIDDTDDFDLNYFLSVTDNVDGVISDYSVEGMPAKDGDKWESGKHVITVRAKDSSNNESAAEMIVRIYETEEETTAVNGAANSSQSNAAATYAAGNYAGAGSIVNAALAQIGVNQDCTALVSNSLRAVGIYFHDWPSGYLSLGSVVSASEAQPGDLIYYANGGLGMAHIAVYIGNGQAVHGGWHGYTTVIASANVVPGAVYIRLR